MKWYSYSKRSTIATQRISLQITANRFDQPSASAVQTAIEYQYDEIRCDARTYVAPTIIPEDPPFDAPTSGLMKSATLRINS